MDGLEEVTSDERVHRSIADSLVCQDEMRYQGYPSTQDFGDLCGRLTNEVSVILIRVAQRNYRNIIIRYIQGCHIGYVAFEPFGKSLLVQKC